MSSSDRFQFFKTSVPVCASVLRHMRVEKHQDIDRSVESDPFKQKKSSASKGLRTASYDV